MKYKNIFSDLEKDYPIVSQEEIIKRDPEVIVVLHPGSITNRLAWQKISAIQHGRVYADFNPDDLLRPGPRLTKGFRQLKGILRE